MPELQFIGKEFVYNHHLTVPYRPLIVNAAKSLGDGSLDDNLIIHGDNLHALKALLPRYAGKVDCIFIDPPYNTGNENWAYNDNVNSPLMKEWLSSNPINAEDMLRHDKWCCMMWPRLRLLWELLAETGSLWITLDENECGNALLMLDEIFGEANRVVVITWRNKVSPSNDAKWFSDDFDSLIVYAKNKATWRPNRLERTEQQLGYYTNVDNDPRGPWNSKTYTCNKSAEERPRLYYSIRNPHTGEIVWPSKTAVWAYSEEVSKQHAADNRIFWGVDGTAKPRLKVFLSEAEGVTPRSVWDYTDTGSTQSATIELQSILPASGFTTPKPTRLIDRILSIAVGDETHATVLDSFAGSGTTAHAVLKANDRDGGNRRFILVETEDYADTLTAERVRRVIKGYPYSGTQREMLLEKKLNWSHLQKAEPLVTEAKNTATLYAGSFDQVETKLDDGTLKVIGIRNIKETAPGLGGTFTYCTLGEPIDLDKILTGESLPSFENMASWLVNTAYGKTVPPSVDHRGEGLAEWYVGELDSAHVWLIYRPDKAFLQSRESTLTLELAEAMAQAKPSKPHLVFAPAKYVGKKALDALVPKVEFAPLPFALYRMERG